MSLSEAIFIFLVICSTSACTQNEPFQTSDSKSKNASVSAAPSLSDSAKEPNVQGDFSDLVQRYESKSREEWQRPDEVIELLGDVEGKVIADIGAGTGYFSFRLLYLGAEVIATDIDARFLDWMNNQAKEFAPDISERLTTRRVSPSSSGLNSGEVDGVIMINTSSYIKDRQSYFSALRKGMKPGGQAIIVDFKTQRVPVDAPKLEERAILGYVERDLLNAGFNIDLIYETLLDFQWVIVAENPEN